MLRSEGGYLSVISRKELIPRIAMTKELNSRDTLVADWVDVAVSKPLKLTPLIFHSDKNMRITKQELAAEQKQNDAENRRQEAETKRQQEKETKFHKLGIDINCSRDLATNLLFNSQSIEAYGDDKHEFQPFTTHCLYSIDGMTPTQKLANGYLLMPNPNMGYQASIMAFVLVYTDDNWDANQSLEHYPNPIRYDGKRKYIALNGFERTVHTFKVWKGELP